MAAEATAVLGLLILTAMIAAIFLLVRLLSKQRKPAAPLIEKGCPSGTSEAEPGVVLYPEQGTLRIEVTYPSGSRTVYRAVPLRQTLLDLGPPDAFICDVCGGETPMGAVHVCTCPVCGLGVPLNMYDKEAGKCRVCAGEGKAS